ncbi:serine/threonine-protein kinase pim-1-like [Corvus hawaiiensis]|uniref:serine/threonine-protein kinase pim-1-like n=1 Tax=Corvus hawaiiensis TaxID=134902 RepID=UPI002018C268|nr:serine/threonine-protein kinase pim-1-like [Corvus hawaiiensis]
MQRYQWRVLPQGMKNSPTICQWYVARILSPIRKKAVRAVILHYVDNVLVCAPTQQYLDWTLGEINDNPKTLQKLHQLCESINWVRQLLGLTTEDLAPLFNLLCGNEDLKSLRQLTEEARNSLIKVQEALSSRQAHCYAPGKAQEALQEQYRLGSLLGSGGFGSIYSITQLADGALMAIKCVLRDCIWHWGELPNSACALLEIVLLDKVSTGFRGVIQLLEWVEFPNSFLLVLECPERCQDLLGFLVERRFQPKEEAQGLFGQVLEAVQHCTSCGALHQDIKPENLLVDLATRQLKLIDFGCGAVLQDTAYTQFAGPLFYSPPEWIHHQRYHGEAATIWSLGLLLYHLVVGKHLFRRGQEIIWGWILFPQWLSPGGSSSLQHGGNTSAGRQQRAQGHPTLAALRRWHMSCSPAALQSTESMGKFRHSSGHTQHGLDRGMGEKKLTGSFSN